jgi:hypothetical protein
MVKFELPFLETMITQACNLSCHGCTNYSDINFPGYVTWEQGRHWLSAWNQKLEIRDFGIIGGEPLINPEVDDWILGARSLLPNAQIRFTTNGLLLRKHIHLLDLFQEIGNCVFKITVHVNDTKLEELIEEILDSRSWESVCEHGITRWKTGNNFRLQINRPNYFLKTYLNDYHDMTPHDSDPNAAFAICIQQTCPLLHDGRIYKCSTAGLLKQTLEKFGNPNVEKWENYIDHGIGLDSNDDDIRRFLDNFGKPNKICGQCPDNTATKIDHIKFVKYKSA